MQYEIPSVAEVLRVGRAADYDEMELTTLLVVAVQLAYALARNEVLPDYSAGCGCVQCNLVRVVEGLGFRPTDSGRGAKVKD